MGRRDDCGDQHAQPRHADSDERGTERFRRVVSFFESPHCSLWGGLRHRRGMSVGAPRSVTRPPADLSDFVQPRSNAPHGRTERSDGRGCRGARCARGGPDPALGPGIKPYQEPMRPPFLRRRTIVQSRGIVTPSVFAGKFVAVGSPLPGCCMLMNAVR